MKIFISWSGKASRLVAEALSEWLPKVIQGVEPFVSAKDIDKGANWVSELSRELEHAEFGIICLAPDNLLSPWLNYEAGAITKSVNSRVAPVLFEVTKEDVKPPMSQLQLTSIDREEFELLLNSINKAAGNRLDQANVAEAVEVWWPRLLESINKIEKPRATPRPDTEVPAEPEQPRVDISEMIEEILHHTRRLDMRVRRMESERPPEGNRTKVASRRSSALRYLQRQFEQVGVEVTSTRDEDTSLDLMIGDTLPDPVPDQLLEAGRKVANREAIEVRIFSPDRVVLIGADGEVVQAPF